MATPVIIAPCRFLKNEPIIRPIPEEASMLRKRNPSDFRIPIRLISNLAPIINPTVIRIIILTNENSNIARILPTESFQSWTGIDFNFKKRPLWRSSAILAVKLDMPAIITENVNMESVFWPLASAWHYSGTILRKINTPTKSQVKGHAITQKRDNLSFILSLKPLIKVAVI